MEIFAQARCEHGQKVLQTERGSGCCFRDQNLQLLQEVWL